MNYHANLGGDPEHDALGLRRQDAPERRASILTARTPIG